MSTIIEVKYFNSFWMKKLEDTTTTPTSSNPTWPGLPWNPFGYMSFPINAAINTNPNSEKSWYIEEARIKGGFNNTIVSQGVKAYLNEESPDQDNRQSSLIYSGIYNSRTDINNTNVFSTAEPIFKSLDPAYGSVQKLFAEDTNLLILQENKVSKALIDKDAIYSAEGQGTPVTTQNLVIGQIVPYLGRYGIGKNPESFAQFGFRKYFVDPDRNAVLRLSRDGLTEISEYGMQDYFRDRLTALDDEYKTNLQSWTRETQTDPPSATFDASGVDACDVLIGSKVLNISGSTAQDTGAVITNVVDLGTSPPTFRVSIDKPITAASTGYFSYNYKSKIIGSWDNYSRYYTVSMQETPNFVSTNQQFQTLAYDEDVRGWVSFFSYKPSFAFSLKGNYYTTSDYSLYQHYQETESTTEGNYGKFYGVRYPSTVTFVFNTSPSVKKVFQTISYEGDNGWQVGNINTDLTKYDDGQTSSDNSSVILSYDEGLYTDSLGYPFRAGFDRKENLYVASIKNNSILKQEEVISGSNMTGLKGYLMQVQMSIDSSTDLGGPKELWAVGTKFVQSS